jgi:hypothetical protein
MSSVSNEHWLFVCLESRYLMIVCCERMWKPFELLKSLMK